MAGPMFEAQGREIAFQTLRSIVQQTVDAMASGEVTYFRLELLTREQFGAGGADRAAFTRGESDDAYGVRVAPAHMDDAGAVPLSAFYGKDSQIPEWTARLWEGWATASMRS
jgi:hypothetical protein